MAEAIQPPGLQIGGAAGNERGLTQQGFCTGELGAFGLGANQAVDGRHRAGLGSPFDLIG